MTKKPSFKSRLRQGSRKSRNVLIVLAALLVTSGLIRIGSSSGLAIARESDTQSAKAEMQSGTLVPITTSVELEPVVEALRQRESNLNSKEEKLNERISEFEQASAQREKKLKEIEMRVGEKLQELKKAEESLSATIVVAETAAEEDLVKLTAVYENMKPKSAAVLFEEMAPEFSAGFLARMRPEAAALVLAGMSAERAYSVSAILAGRNAGVPKN